MCAWVLRNPPTQLCVVVGQMIACAAPGTAKMIHIPNKMKKKLPAPEYAYQHRVHRIGYIGY